MGKFNDWIDKKIKQKVAEYKYLLDSIQVKQTPDSAVIKINDDKVTGTLPDGTSVDLKIIGQTRRYETGFKIGAKKYAIYTRFYKPKWIGSGKDAYLILRTINSDIITNQFTWYVKKLDEDQLYLIDVYAISGITFQSGIQPFISVKFSPDGNYILVGGVTYPDETSFIAQWGILSDWSFNNITNRVDGDISAGSHVVNIDDLNHAEDPDVPGFIASTGTDVFCGYNEFTWGDDLDPVIATQLLANADYLRREVAWNPVEYVFSYTNVGNNQVLFVDLIGNYTDLKRQYRTFRVNSVTSFPGNPGDCTPDVETYTYGAFNPTTLIRDVSGVPLVLNLIDVMSTGTPRGTFNEGGSGNTYFNYNEENVSGDFAILQLNEGAVNTSAITYTDIFEATSTSVTSFPFHFAVYTRDETEEGVAETFTAINNSSNSGARFSNAQLRGHLQEDVSRNFLLRQNYIGASFALDTFVIAYDDVEAFYFPGASSSFDNYSQIKTLDTASFVGFKLVNSTPTDLNLTVKEFTYTIVDAAPVVSQGFSKEGTTADRNTYRIVDWITK